MDRRAVITMEKTKTATCCSSLNYLLSILLGSAGGPKHLPQSVPALCVVSSSGQPFLHVVQIKQAFVGLGRSRHAVKLVARTQKTDQHIVSVSLRLFHVMIRGPGMQPQMGCGPWGDVQCMNVCVHVPAASYAGCTIFTVCTSCYQYRFETFPNYTMPLPFSSIMKFTFTCIVDFFFFLCNVHFLRRNVFHNNGCCC